MISLHGGEISKKADPGADKIRALAVAGDANIAMKYGYFPRITGRISLDYLLPGDLHPEYGMWCG